MRMRLTERDLGILRALSLCVRVLSLEQVARVWWSSDADAARWRLRAFVDQDLLLARRFLGVQLGPLPSPLAVWQPGVMRPDFGPIAWTLETRWSAAPQRTVIYYAARRVSQLFGGVRTGRIARPFQVAHDLAVAEMFFAVCRRRIEVDRLWVDEDRLAPFRRGEKLPDAILAPAPYALPSLVLELGGRYGKRRLQAFHRDCDIRGLAYEIW
ncbi:MAG: hypothetical protein DCC67_03645 [Planctomycetota bacterium]|nr:MAG: hypothetical protein DCC67_03645 [Planctomycetota bacterium]